MKILGIETSCDETGEAIIEKSTADILKIISNVVATSSDMHAKTGGVIPENAAREQLKSIIPVINETLKIAKLKIENIDAIGVTIGPGLIGSLLVGVETAKPLAYIYKKPIIPVNHMVGHVYANWLDTNNIPQFPGLALVVSGGHTDLILIKNHTPEGRIYIGGTRDDAAGEAFDKTARILGLPYPGGPNLSKLAQKYLDQNPNAKLNFFPRPMISDNNFDWSFSGLKTSVSNYLSKNKNFDKEKVAAEVQEAIVDSLAIKSLRAIEKFSPSSFLLAGGVAANTRLREKFLSGMPMRHSGKLAPIS